jgi:hypothetical protein
MPNSLRFIFFVAVFTALLQAQAQTSKPTKGQNAAVKYLRADASLRQAYSLSTDSWLKIEEALEQPISADDEKLVTAASEALAEFQHAANVEACDWQLSVEDGPFANTSHRGAIRELVAVSGLRARIRFRDGDRKGAISDVLAGYAAARHLSLDGSIASVLFGYKVEREISGVLQTGLGDLTPAELAALESGFERLPQGSSMRSAVEAEKLNRNDLLEIIGNAHTRDDLISRMSAGVPVFGNDRKKAQEVVDGCGGSLSGVVDCIDKQTAFYKKWTANFGLPPERFQEQYQADYALASIGNPMLKLFTPSLSRFKWAEAYNETLRALLRAAVAIEQGGAKELPRHPDPFNGQPFSYTTSANGFRLESLLRENGKPLSISVFPALKK